MRKPPPPRPTDGELEILSILWDIGPTTVRQLRDAWSRRKGRNVGNTTALKMLQIMLGKGLVRRDDRCRPQIYSASDSRERTQRRLVSDLLARAFGGSPKLLVMQLLSTHSASTADLARIEALLDEHERGGA